jgi:hypothetical protein
MPDFYSNDVLTGVINNLNNEGQTPLLDAFFREVVTSQEENISFDVEAEVMGLAPFVSPVVGGEVMREVGFTTNTIKPAYVKPKRAFDSNRPFQRTIGEPFGGNLSPQQRLDKLVNQHLGYDRLSIDRRLEWMAAQALLTGTVTIAGRAYPTKLVDFGRTNTLTKALVGAARWGQVGVKILDLLQTWSDEVLAASGSAPKNVILDTAAWVLFRNDIDVKDRLALQRRANVEPSLNQDASLLRAGLEYKGEIDGFFIWVYSGTYKDSSGVKQKYLPANTCLMVGDVVGKRHFGAIRDERAGFQAVPYFAKSWVEEDPPVRLVMTQSAPLVVPYRPNASLAVTVA